jgi:mRNA interferase MazF
MKGLAHGQVWWADLDKVRPVVILTRGTVAEKLSHVLVAPVTTVTRNIPAEVQVGLNEGVQPGSVVNFDNVTLLSVALLIDRAGGVSTARWPEFCEAMRKVMAC